MKYIDLTINTNMDELESALNRASSKLSDVSQPVDEILNAVRMDGDSALFRFAKTFDGCDIVNLRVSPEEIDAAWDAAPPALREVLLRSRDNISAWHSLQTYPDVEIKKDGILIKQIVQPIRRVGLYVPAGRFPLPSTVLMNAVPAICAGVKEIALITPPAEDGRANAGILAAAKAAGVDEVYVSGGAQAIAALAYGTETIKKVDKIFGPGNVWVTAAKKAVYGTVGIDMLAGPSEVLIIADQTANPVFIAADLLSQAEHDSKAAAVLISDNRDILIKTEEEILRQLNDLPADSPAHESLKDYGLLILTSGMKEAAAISNSVAPEHLEILCDGKDENEILSRITAAGSIFLGHYTPEPLGDYYAGVNHTLPTSGTARFYSPLSTYDFVKRTSVLSYDKKSLTAVADDIILFAESEGLAAHAASIAKRIESYNEE